MMRVTIEFDDDEKPKAVYVLKQVAAMIGTGTEDNRIYKNKWSLSNIYHTYGKLFRDKSIKREGNLTLS